MGSQQENLLTKAQILEGMNRRETIYVESLGGHVVIRPLSSGEWAAVQAAQLAGFTQTVRPETKKGKKGEKDESNPDMELAMDLGRIITNEYESQVLAVFHGMVSEEKWTLEQVRNIPHQALEEIATEVFEITGVTEEVGEQIESFRQLTTRAKNDSPSRTGVPTGPDAGGANATAGRVSSTGV